MKCSECRQARKHIGDSVFCVLYGMIIKKTHECSDEDTLPPWDEENPLPVAADSGRVRKNDAER